MKRFDVVTLFPEMFSALTQSGVTGRAESRGIYDLVCWNPREFADDPRRTVDDRPYGGGPGMLMKAPILSQSVRKAKQLLGDDALVVAMSPQGAPVDEAMIARLVAHKAIIFVAGRYEGFDERFLEQDVDLELSVGDIVVSGGEMPAMLVMDSLIRRIPGVLGDEMSAEQDSFVDGLLDCPHYTRPEIFEGRAVPEVLLSGDHARIADWRAAQALKRTLDRRPDLLDWADLTDEQRVMLARWDLNAHL